MAEGTTNSLGYRLAHRAARMLPAVPGAMLHHRIKTGDWPNLWRPQTLNDKTLYRRLHDTGVGFAPWADKLGVKADVARIAGPDYVTPTLWHGTELPDDIASWPRPFVIKANNASSRNIPVLKDQPIDWNIVRETTRGWMVTRFGDDMKERWYTLIQPELLIEPWLSATGIGLPEYRMFVFSGRAHVLYVREFGEVEYLTLFDRDWRQRHDARYHKPPNPNPAPKPDGLEDWIAAAERLAAHFAFVRMDFYMIDGRPRFSEMTFAPNGGNSLISPRAFDLELGRMWTGPLIHPLT